MATVLFAWELGSGLNHVQQLLAVARPLAEQGHQPVFAVQNVVDTAPLLRDDSFPMLQAPHYPQRTWKRTEPFVATSFADVLAKHGYADVDELSALVAAWQRLVDLVRPELIVADYAPTLCLAAFRALPIAQLGSWFGMPPVEQPTFPRLAAGTPLVSQEHVLATMQEVQRRRRSSIPATVTEFLATTHRYSTTLPELDPYRALRRTPNGDPLGPLPPASAGPGDASFFAYLSADFMQAEEILTGLALAGCRGTVYLRGAETDLKTRLRLQGLTVLDRPGAMVELLRDVSVFVHHGGQGGSQTALAMGRPQLLLPQHLEQTINAHHLLQLGVGYSLIDQPSAEGVVHAMQHLLIDRRYAEQALRIGLQLNQRPRHDLLPEIIHDCIVVLRSAT
jgi:rhamnosyltransferase subunit B